MSHFEFKPVLILVAYNSIQTVLLNLKKKRRCLIFFGKPTEKTRKQSESRLSCFYNWTLMIARSNCWLDTDKEELRKWRADGLFYTQLRKFLRDSEGRTAPATVPGDCDCRRFVLT